MLKFIDLFIRLMAIVVIPCGVAILVKTNIEIVKEWKNEID